MTDLNNITIDWASYGNAVREGIECERDETLPMNPAIWAGLDGNTIVFEFGPSRNLVGHDENFISEEAYDICNYESDRAAENFTDADLAEIAEWYSSPGNFDGRQTEIQLLDSLADAQ